MKKEIMTVEQVMATKVKRSLMGLQVDEKTFTMEDAQTILNAFIGVRDKSKWIIGDLLNIAERKWGEKYTGLVDANLYEPATLRQWAWVCRNVHLSMRIDKLSFQHHLEVAGLPDDVQKEILEKASSEEWSSRSIKDEVKNRGMKKLKDAPKIEADPEIAAEKPKKVVPKKKTPEPATKLAKADMPLEHEIPVQEANVIKIESVEKPEPKEEKPIWESDPAISKAILKDKRHIEEYIHWEKTLKFQINMSSDAEELDYIEQAKFVKFCEETRVIMAAAQKAVEKVMVVPETKKEKYGF